MDLEVAPLPSTSTAMPRARVAILYVPSVDHFAAMVDAVRRGVEEAGASAEVFQICEVTSDGKAALPTNGHHPRVSLCRLCTFDGFLFGLPGKYGELPAQFKAWWESTDSLWRVGSLIGKPVGVFDSNKVQNGGQDSIGLTVLPEFVHHGMLFVHLGYRDSRVLTYGVAHGVPASGEDTLAGPDRSRHLCARARRGVDQGRAFAEVTQKLMVRP